MSDKLTKYGKFMYKFTERGIKFLAKHQWLYYLLNCSWGLFLTVVGLLITLFMLLTGKKPTKYYEIYYFKIGKDWGGFETGLMFIRDENSSEVLNAHELGHTYQNAIFGPFQIFLITIPSFVRYWYREIRFTRKNIKPTTLYDDIWFESSASNHGLLVLDIKNKNRKEK